MGRQWCTGQSRGQDLAVETVTSGLFSPISSKALEQELLKEDGRSWWKVMGRLVRQNWVRPLAWVQRSRVAHGA